jgi:hypothetical protein
MCLRNGRQLALRTQPAQVVLREAAIGNLRANRRFPFDHWLATLRHDYHFARACSHYSQRLDDECKAEKRQEDDV